MEKGRKGRGEGRVKKQRFKDLKIPDVKVAEEIGGNHFHSEGEGAVRENNTPSQSRRGRGGESPHLHLMNGPSDDTVASTTTHFSEVNEEKSTCYKNGNNI